MKKNSNTHRTVRHAAFWTIAALMLPGCIDYSTTTTVHEDGSCERMVERKSDNQSGGDSLLLVPHPEGWKFSTRKSAEQGSKTTYVKTAVRRFATLEDLSREYEGYATPNKLHVRVEAERRFRWFFSYLRITETYTQELACERIPLAPYLTDEEALRYQNGEKNDTLDRKAKEWSERMVLEAFYKPLVEAADTLHDPIITRERVAAEKERVFAGLTQEKKSAQNADDVIKVLAEIFGTPRVSILRQAVEAGWKVVEEQLKNTGHSGDSFSNAYTMPGLIMETTAVEISGNRVAWKIDGERLVLRPYVMTVESRIVNIWAFMVTGFVVFFFAGIMIVLAVRRRTV